MTDRRHGTKPIVFVNDGRLPAPLDVYVRSVTVDQDLTSPSMCTVAISDPTRSAISDANLQLGASLEVHASAIASDDEETIFVGVIHGLDVVFDQQCGQSIELVAYDEAFRLTQHRLTKSFNDVTTADVISDVSSQIGLSTGTMELEEVVHPHLGLFDETPWEFVTRHAAASGCVVRYIDDELNIVKPTAASEAPSPGEHGSRDAMQLVPGHNVTQMRIHSTSARQVEEVEVRGWDPAQKKMIVGNARAETTTIDVESSPAQVASQLGSAKLIEPRPSLDVQAGCDHEAVALAASFADQHRVATGEAFGDPALRAGEVVSLGAVDAHAGGYLLTNTKHRFDVDGYTTEFSCSGLHDLSLLALFGGHDRLTRAGVSPAIVTNIADPDSLWRVKLKFPWLSDDYESGWSRVYQYGAGPGRGFHWYPEVGDEVGVAFIDGDPMKPVVLGGLFNGEDAPPFEDFVDSDAGEVVVRGMTSRLGHSFVLVDRSGEEAVSITSASGGVQLLLDQAGKKVSIISDGEVAVESKGDLKIDSKGKATIAASTGLDLTSDGPVNIKGSMINLN